MKFFIRSPIELSYFYLLNRKTSNHHKKENEGLRWWEGPEPINLNCLSGTPLFTKTIGPWKWVSRQPPSQKKTTTLWCKLLKWQLPLLLSLHLQRELLFSLVVLLHLEAHKEKLIMGKSRSIRLLLLIYPTSGSKIFFVKRNTCPWCMKNRGSKHNFTLLQKREVF